MNSYMRILSNIDLEDEMFSDVARQYDEMIPVTSDLLFDDLRYASLLESDIPIELVGFFQRRCHVAADAATPALAALDRVFATLRRAGGSEKVGRMILIDCGDPLMTPLTDLSILGQYVERVRDRLPPDAEVRILTAEVTQSGAAGPALVLKDTRSEAFVTAVADHTRLSMDILNNDGGYGGPRRVADISKRQISRKLQEMLAAD